MNDMGKVVAGIVVFLGIVTTPFWYNAFGGRAAQMPALDRSLPVVEPGAPGFEDLPRDLARNPDGTPAECVEPTEYMRANHMAILNRWRDEVVREDVHVYRATTGKEWPHLKLTGTCLKCHAKKAEFCDRCHDWAGVKPYCWDCHLDRVAKGGR